MNQMRHKDAGRTRIDELQFRNVLGHFASGVTIVTVTHKSAVHGMTVTSFTSVSLDPPLVLVCINKRCRTHELVDTAGHFAVNMLRAEHCERSECFAGRHPESEDRFFNVAWRTEVTGAPIFRDCLAWLDCSVVSRYDGGDHTIFLGKVLAGDLVLSGEPLIYYQGRYCGLESNGALISRLSVNRAATEYGS